MKKSLLLVALLGLTLLSGCTPNEPDAASTPQPTQSPAENYQTGLALMAKNDFTGAADQFKLAISVDPQYADAYTRLALAELWGGLPGGESLTHAERGAELAPADAYAQAVLAYAQLDRHILLNAVGNADHAFQLDSDDSFVAMVFALALTSNYEYERAWQVLTEVYSAHLESPEVHLALGYYYSNTGDFGRAMAAYDRAVELDPKNSIWLFHQAKFYLSAKRYSLAGTAISDMLDLNPDYLPGLALQAQLEIAKSDFEAAQPILDRIEELSPEWYLGDLLRGDMASLRADYEASLGFLTLAREKVSDSFVPDLKLTTSYLQQSDCSEAQTAIDPFNGEAYLGMAQAYQILGDADLVQKMMLKALALAPASSDVHFAQGDLFAQQNDLSAAEAEIRTGLALNPYDLGGYNQLASILLSHFRVDAALEVVEDGLDLNPDHPVTQRLYGSLLVLSHRAEEALPVLQGALGADPENGELYLYYALALRDLGDYDLAADNLSTYISIREDGNKDSDRLDNIWRLLEALRGGYSLTTEEGFSLISDLLARVTGHIPELTLETNASHEATLVVEMAVSQSQIDTGGYLIDLVAAALASAEVLPRMTPPLEGGLSIRVNYGGRGLYLARLDFDDIRFYANTLLTPDELVERIAFDLADSSVQRGSIDQILREVADLRDLALDDIPDYEIIPRGEVGEYFEDDFDQEFIETLGNEYAAMALLGVLPEETDAAEMMLDFISTNVAGFYNPGQEKIYIVADEQLTSSDQLTIVHESEHAIADQEFTLGMIRSRTTDSDRYQAATALIEGDAELLSEQYLHQVIPDIGWWTDLSDSAARESESDVDYPSYLINVSMFPYVYGRNFVSFLYDQGGWRQVNTAMWDPPSSSEQIMHPQRYLDEDNPQRVYLEDPSDELKGTWEMIDEDVMGEYGVYLTLSEYFGRASAGPAAEGWGGDRYILLERRGGVDLIFAWRIAWDTPAEAAEFWESLTIAMFHRQEYREVVEDFSLPATRRTWSNQDGYLVMSIDDFMVTILVGDQLAELEIVLEALD
jgi:tetratricopeptide (TPR) repeat protein